jgi:hypothetical protein
MRLGRFVVVAALLFVGATPSRHEAVSPCESLAMRAPEVRLRKLHLVRPDLIPYPLYYEVVC